MDPGPRGLEVGLSTLAGAGFVPSLARPGTHRLFPKEDAMYLSVPLVLLAILVVLAPAIWLGWWLVASAGEKVSGHRPTPHGR